MPEPAYRVARRVAQRITRELELTPPFDLERVASRWAQIVEEDIPGRADVATVHAARAGHRPLIVIAESTPSTAEHRRFAVAHALGHVVLGWHPLGLPCVMSSQPSELPVASLELVEGEASAFARELLAPAAWITSFAAFDVPAALIRQVAERAGIELMPAARAVATVLPAGTVWVVADAWDRVLDAGRAPGTTVRPPRPGDELDRSLYARHAANRHRDSHDGITVHVWSFDGVANAPDLPLDQSARDIVRDIAASVGMDDAAAHALQACMDGAAGWANEHAAARSVRTMRAALNERLETVIDDDVVIGHPRFSELVQVKSVELVSRRLTR